MINFHIWAINIPPVTYLNGILLFLGGLSIVRVHNHWRGGWPVIVTLVGWFGIVGGLFRVFAPEAQQAAPGAPTYAVISVLCAFGIVLTFKAYGREAGTAAPASH
jgi:hypothetical protein